MAQKRVKVIRNFTIWETIPIRNSKYKILNFTRTKVADLGFAKPPITSELWARIKKVGNLFCDEACFHLYQKLKDQPNGDSFWLAKERIVDRSGDSDIFYLTRYDAGKLWLSGPYITPGPRWNLSSEIVFVCRSSVLKF